MAFRRAAGMIRESVWSEQTADGRLLAVVLMESEDVHAVLWGRAGRLGSRAHLSIYRLLGEDQVGS